MQSFIQKDEHDHDSAASARSVDPEPFLLFGGGGGRMVESEYVYGRATEQIRASLATLDVDDDHDHSRGARDDDSAEGGDDDQTEQEEHADTLGGLAPSAPFFYDSGGYEAARPHGERSISDDTDQSCSLASEQSGLDSPPPSPLFGSSIRQMTDLSGVAADTAAAEHHSYEQRIEATLTESMGKYRRIEGSGSSGTAAESPTHEPLPSPQFTMNDVSHFDEHFGRELYLEQLGRSFVDGSGSKSLASYRMSSYHRISMATDIIKQGWLVKRAEVVPSWHRRWFTLRRM